MRSNILEKGEGNRGTRGKGKERYFRKKVSEVLGTSKNPSGCLGRAQ